MIKNLTDWKTQVYDYNTELIKLLDEKTNLNYLYFGFEIFDGKAIEAPEILFLGINPGRGNGNAEKKILETDQISYLDIFDEVENYRRDYPNTYHLAEKTIKFFRMLNWGEEKILDVFQKKVVKTNFFHLATANMNDLKSVISSVGYWDTYFSRSAYFAIQLINILKPKVVILEGKSVFDYIVTECYQKKVWNDNNYGYLFDGVNNTHIIGYKRSGFTNKNAESFTNKLKEIFE